MQPLPLIPESIDVGMVKEEQWIGWRSCGIHISPDCCVNSVVEMLQRELESSEVGNRRHRGQLCGGGKGRGFYTFL